MRKMKNAFRQHLILFFFLPFAVGIGSYGCQSDLPKGKADSTVLESKPDAVGERLPAEILTSNQRAALIARMEDLKNGHDNINRELAYLRQQYDALPAEVKKNAVNCDHLEAQLDGHLENGRLRIADLDQLINELKHPQRPPQTQSPEDVVSSQHDLGYYETRISEYQNDLPQIKAEYPVMKHAIDQLNASIPKQGKGVVLFESFKKK